MANPTTFRLGDLAALLDERAASESKVAGHRVTPSAILKRALRAYLSGENAYFIDAQSIINELGRLRSDLARVGGNLNQLAHIFNMENRVDGDELQKTHEALRAEFRQVMSAFRQMQEELYKRR